MTQHDNLKIALVDIPIGELVEHTLNYRGQPLSLLLMRNDTGIRVWRNVCPHAGRRLDWAPGKFLFEQGKLVCAAHGAMIDLNDGRCVSGPGRGSGLQAIPAQTQIDTLVIDLSAIG